jgi:hypothetical protein
MNIPYNISILLRHLLHCLNPAETHCLGLHYFLREMI